MPKLADTITGARRLGGKIAQSQRQPNPDGRMPLMDHLRELRNRLMKAVAAILVALAIGLIPVTLPLPVPPLAKVEVPAQVPPEFRELSERQLIANIELAA